MFAFTQRNNPTQHVERDARHHLCKIRLDFKSLQRFTERKSKINANGGIVRGLFETWNGIYDINMSVTTVKIFVIAA